MPKRKFSEVCAFRAQYLTYGLTYSRCPMEREDLMNKLLLKIPYISDYYVARETHKEEKVCPYHLHVWFQVSQKPNFTNQNCFDIDGYHPNIGNKKRNWIYNYLKKQDIDPYTNIPTGFIQLAIEGRLEDATKQFINLHPKDYAINKVRIDANLKSLGKKKKEDHVYPLTSDYVPDWDPAETSLHVVGESGCGKTEWAKSYVVHKLKKTYLRVTHMDGLKKYTDEDVIIWDDLSFAHIPREAAIHVCEVKNARDIHCRHAVASIPPGIGNIFLSNDPNIWPTDNFGAIERRVTEVAPYIRFY